MSKKIQTSSGLQGVIALLAGAVSGVLSYLFLLRDFPAGHSDLDLILSYVMPGLIFGCFIAFYAWRSTKSVLRTVVWPFVSFLSFSVAFLAWFFLPFVVLLGGSLMYGASGVVGALVILIAFTKIFGKKIDPNVFTNSLFQAALIPIGIIILSIYMGYDDAFKPLNAAYLPATGQSLAILVLWQAWMLYRLEGLMRK